MGKIEERKYAVSTAIEKGHTILNYKSVDAARQHESLDGAHQQCRAYQTVASKGLKHQAASTTQTESEASGTSKRDPLWRGSHRTTPIYVNWKPPF